MTFFFNPSDPLDAPLVRLTQRRQDAVSLRKLYQGVLITGKPGSAKTTSSGRILAKALLRTGAGMLVPCVKASEPDRWVRYAQECGRSRDVRLFGVNQPHRFNFLTHEAAQPGVQVDHLIELIDTVTEKEGAKGGKDAAFWEHQKHAFFRNALSLLLDAREPVTFPALHEILESAPETPGQVRDRSWQSASYVYALIQRAQTNGGSRSLPYWLSKWPGMLLDTRRSLNTTILGLLDVLTHGAVATLFSETSNLTPDDILAGKIVILDFPELVHGEAARVCSLIWMQTLQRALNRRVYDPKRHRPVASFVDEYPQLCHRRDVKHQATAREQGHAIVRVCQSYSQILLGLGEKSAADAFGELFGLVLFHANLGETNEWAARLIGKEPVVRPSVSGSNRTQGDANASVSESMEDSCPSVVFTRLKEGGPQNRFEAEAVAFMPGHRFANGKTWMTVPFSQQD